MLVAAVGRSQTVERTLELGTATRHYLLHVPPGWHRDGTAALILVFHGRGGSAAGIERLTGFSRLADRAGFAVVYPEGESRSWNDGRELSDAAVTHSAADDVAFVSRLLDRLIAELRPSPRRIFAAGFSNGATFTHYLAAHLAWRIAAIAAVSGGISGALARDFHPAAPVSVLQIQGTDDPLIPYTGGAILGGRLGRQLGADSSALLWEERDGIRATAATGELPDTDPRDGCRVAWRRWSGGRADTEIWLYRLRGGGHTWPGGAQYLSEHVVGRVCRDFNATFAIWDFFSRHAKPLPRPRAP